MIEVNKSEDTSGEACVQPSNANRRASVAHLLKFLAGFNKSRCNKAQFDTVYASQKIYRFLHLEHSKIFPFQ